MRFNLAFCVVLACASVTLAKEPKAYQTGKLLQMDSVPCDLVEGNASAEMLGTDSGNKNTHEPLCQVYLLQAEHVIYRIRPRDEKHAALLPIGGQAQFRIQKDKLLLRIEDLDGKEHEYIVVSISLRIDNSTADATPARVNHLQ